MNETNGIRGISFPAALRHLLSRPSLLVRAASFLAETGSPSALIGRVVEYIGIKQEQTTLTADDRLPDSFFDWKQLDKSAMTKRLAQLNYEPKFSIVTPLYNTPPIFLSACIGSVRDQIYRNWEMILVDDASPNPAARSLATRYAATDSRIKLIERVANGNISAASNDGLDAATGEYCMFLDHDDELAPMALLAFAEEIVRHPEMDAIYSDQWKCDEAGRIIDHHFKPDWSPTMLEGVMYVGHLLSVRTSLAKALGGFDSAYDGVQDFEFMLRLSEKTNNIHHIREPLYKWRAIAGSLAAGTDEKSGIEVRQARAVNAHLERTERPMVAVTNSNFSHRLRLKAASGQSRGKVSIVIPSKDQGEVIARCLDSIFTLTAYPDFEIILVDNGTTDPIALAAFERHPIKRVAFNEKFNYSKANNIGVGASAGEYILLLNNDTEVLDGDWLNDLVAYLADKGVGAVGPVLLYPDRRVQHAGVVLGARGTADHAMRLFPEHVDGYAGSLSCSREVSAVTAACLLMRKELYVGLGGLSEDYATHYQDVDLCLKIRRAGLRIVCAAYPRLIHYESLTRKEGGYDFVDRAILIDRWWEDLTKPDPYYNHNLNLERLDYSLSRFQG